MSLTLDRDALHAALGRIGKIVERCTTMPILAHLHCTAADGRLVLRGTDLDMEAETSLALTQDEAAPWAFTAPAALFADVVAKIRPGASLALAPDDGTRLKVTSGRSRVTLNILAPADFPDIGPQEASHTFQLAAADIVRLIGATEFAISSEETRYYLCGIYLHVVDGVLRAVATDGHRLARFALPAPDGAADMPGVILPRKFVAELKRLAKDATAPLDVALSDRRVTVTIAGKDATTRLSGKTIDGTFPDYQRITPQNNSQAIALDREACRAAADRVATISGERSQGLKLAFGDGLLRIETISPDVGRAEDEIDADYDGAPVEIGFNGKYLAECLGVLAGDRVRMDLEGPGNPALLRGTGDELTLVLMPMRV